MPSIPVGYEALSNIIIINSALVHLQCINFTDHNGIVSFGCAHIIDVLEFSLWMCRRIDLFQSERFLNKAFAVPIIFLFFGSRCLPVPLGMKMILSSPSASMT